MGYYAKVSQYLSCDPGTRLGIRQGVVMISQVIPTRLSHSLQLVVL